MPHTKPSVAAHDGAGGGPASADNSAGDVAAIVARAATGDEAAWRKLASRYGRRVYAMARSRLRNDALAEDIAQGVFVTLAEKLSASDGAYEEAGRFEAYLFRITMNRVRDEVRRQKRQPASVPFIDEDAGRVSADSGVDRDEMEQLQQALQTLPDPDRRVVELRHLAGMNFKAISNLLNEPVGTLLARHHRALKKLRSAMEGKNRPGRALSPKETP